MKKKMFELVHYFIFAQWEHSIQAPGQKYFLIQNHFFFWLFNIFAIFLNDNFGFFEVSAKKFFFCIGMDAGLSLSDSFTI